MKRVKREATQRVRHELHRREVVVARVTRLGEHFVAIDFRGECLGGFVSMSFDDHVKITFDGPNGEQVRRDYTPRCFNAQSGELTIEFALHGDGAAANWARAAQPGRRAIIGGPRGSMIISPNLDWYVLAGDTSALPAIRRRLAELPAGARVFVVVAAATGDRLLPHTDANAEVCWVDDDDALLGAVCALPLPSGEGFAWAAGEAGTMGRLRQVLVLEKSLAKEEMRVSAYWKRGVAGHHEDFA